MNLTPIMINVHYDINSNKNEKLKPVEKVEKVEELKYDSINNCWYTFNHYKSYSEYAGAIRYSQIGFKGLQDVRDDFTVYIEHDDVDKKELYLDRETGIWFELSKFKKDKYSTSEKDQVTGLNQSGSIKVKVKQKSTDDLIEEYNIIFLPSSLEINDYKIMIAEIYNIYIDLLKNKNSSVRLNEKELLSLKWVEDVINKIEPALKYIDLNPNENFSIQLSKQKHTNDRNRFDIRAEISKSIFMGSPSVKKMGIYKDKNLYEHRVIKQFLASLKFLFELYLKENLLNIKKEQIKNELRVFEDKSNFLNDFNEKDYTALKGQVQKIDEELNKEKEDLTKKLLTINSDHNPLINMYTNINIELKFRVRSLPKNFKCELINNIVITKFETAWNNGWDIELISYSYKNSLNERVLIQWPHPRFSKKLKLELHSVVLKNHVYLMQALNNEEILGKEILINGNVYYDRAKLNQSIDIIGTDTGVGEIFNDYNFTFFNIQSIAVSGIKRPIVKDDVMEDIVPILLNSRDYLRNTDRLLQSKLKTTSYEQKLKLINRISLVNHEEKLYRKLDEKINNLLELSIFKEIDSLEFEKLRPTQVFLHDPYYRIIWNALKEHEYVNTISLNELNSNNYINVTNVNNIYEIWAFLKMIMILKTELGWTIRGKESLSKYIKDFLTNKKVKTLDGFNIELNKSIYSLFISYTPHLPRTGLQPLTPDYRFILQAPNKESKVIYLDAKYRDYIEQGEKEWEKDIKTVAIKKYLRTKSSNPNLNGDVSFILHCDQKMGELKEKAGVSYSAAYDKNFISLDDETESLLKEEYGHKVGSIYLLPQATNSFTSWFRMIMEYHLEDFQTCWSCGELEDNVKVTLAYTERGHLKYYYECSNCNDFWVKVHCRNGHKLIKHTNNYHQQKKDTYAWYVICPVCFNGRVDENNIDNFIEY
ncbi:nuclease domain-containing protein [Metabacillus endolithicus]|uniref:Nuclease domain-containing protein n=1 Tax=Metabacillus endolithicus TaxID=1535204 RepID=A0ABW5C264_9BACI|nr:nuclease domain-containing protein [Metabacillus endolithicus]UPG61644.1 hypothetical protein MVE64_13095 [Metabacillus endolithicus]